MRRCNIQCMPRAGPTTCESECEGKRTAQRGCNVDGVHAGECAHIAAVSVPLAAQTGPGALGIITKNAGGRLPGKQPRSK